MNAIEGDLIVLGDSLVSLGQSHLLSEKEANIIRAWRVEIRGVVKTLGQDLTIVANQVVFSSDEAMLDTSGTPTVQVWIAGNRPASVDTQAAAGPTGANSGNVKIYAASISGKVRVRAVGGDGGRGRDGADGITPTATGGAGPRQRCATNSTGPEGGQGIQGGPAGQAGAPGPAGKGGNVDVWVSQGALAAEQLEVELKGGSAPEAAKPGTQAEGGPGGPGGHCVWYESVRGASHEFEHIVERVSPEGPKGPKGPWGRNAPLQPTLPSKGDGGLLNGHPVKSPPELASRFLTNVGLAEQCTAQQLWAVLKEAERFYLNENYVDAHARLVWISTIAPLLQKQVGGSNHA